MKSSKRGLFIIPHPDDLELSCSITVQKMLRLGYNIKVVTVCSGELTGDPVVREREGRSSCAYLGVQDVVFLKYPQFKMPENRWSIKEDLERIIKDFKPDTTFVPWIEDVHEDHATISELSLVASRGTKNVYYFPTPSSLNFIPDIAVLGTGDMLDKKVAAIKLHETQADSGRIWPEAAVASSSHWLYSFGHHSRFLAERNSPDGVSVEVFKLFKEELFS